MSCCNHPGWYFILLRAVNVDDDFVDYFLWKIFTWVFMINLYLISMNFYDKSLLDFIELLWKIFTWFHWHFRKYIYLISLNLYEKKNTWASSRSFAKLLFCSSSCWISSNSPWLCSLIFSRVVFCISLFLFYCFYFVFLYFVFCILLLLYFCTFNFVFYCAAQAAAGIPQKVLELFSSFCCLL